MVAGWHRMSYVFKNHSLISRVLENQIRKLHTAVGNAVTQGRLIVFGAGSTQLLNAAVHALSPDNSLHTAVGNAVTQGRLIVFGAGSTQLLNAAVHALSTDNSSAPAIKLWHPSLFTRSKDFQFQGDASVWKNNSDSTSNLIEFMTAPNNPDRQLNKAVLHGPYVKAIHDHAYYWPQFTAIPAPAESRSHAATYLTIKKILG
ncbi:Tryptophan aminotransferase-related protein 4 [Vitis vinifera]|uniref:Tryptophan aminotransferase-related protein 4 n=1 Tax=Vitis vinifera TaxID=29760 RepID=A0A438DPW6_VITVI|nr:Tryptophan aminotransferase-related protein 4 [Vitis vinifera]